MLKPIIILIISLILHNTAVVSAGSSHNDSLINALLRKSSEGDPCAMADLSTLYLVEPERSSEDKSQAYKLLEEAGAMGHVQAQDILCELYFYDGSTPEKAMRWCSSAALDKHTTDDPKAENRRLSALWKTMVLGHQYPEMKNLVYKVDWESDGHMTESPAKIGGITGTPETWSCKSIFQ